MSGGAPLTRSSRRFLAGQDERTEAAARAENLVAAMTRPSPITPGSCGLTTPSPPAEKATARQDQARQTRAHDRTGYGQESPKSVRLPP